jgi:hypothetical protein
MAAQRALVATQRQRETKAWTLQSTMIEPQTKTWQHGIRTVDTCKAELGVLEAIVDGTPGPVLRAALTAI